MQYPVPQFTDVEDKIIGPLTITQFGIIFGAGVVVFLAFSASKSVLVAIVFFMLFGLPALMVAFLKINGRPLYKSFGFVIKFITSEKVLTFHKESENFSSFTKLNTVELKAPEPEIQPKEKPKDRLKKLNQILEQQQQEENKLVKE